MAPRMVDGLGYIRRRDTDATGPIIFGWAEDLSGMFRVPFSIVGPWSTVSYRMHFNAGSDERNKSRLTSVLVL